MRACLDTNVWVAAFATRGLCADVLRVVLAERDIVIGQVIGDELRFPLERKLRLPAERIASVDALLSQFEVAPKPALPSPSRSATLPIAGPWQRRSTARPLSS